jgi:peptide/nickel transport system permease protein
VAALDRAFGLNRPLWQQYLAWLAQLVHGRLGVSLISGQPVWTLMLTNLSRTVAVVGLGSAIACGLAMVLGSLQAYWRGSAFDWVVTGLSYLFYAMPAFWLGILFITVFAVHWGWFAAGGLSNPMNPHPTWISWVRHITLPVATIVLVSFAGWARYMRASMEETLLQNYIRTARAKGLSEGAVLFQHALKNAVLPFVTLIGLSLPNLLSGALFVEVVFNYPGMGLLLWNAAQQRDYPVMMGVLLMAGALTVCGNWLADVVYGLIDPRIAWT